MTICKIVTGKPSAKKSGDVFMSCVFPQGRSFSVFPQKLNSIPLYVAASFQAAGSLHCWLTTLLGFQGKPEVSSSLLEDMDPVFMCLPQKHKIQFYS